MLVSGDAVKFTVLLLFGRVFIKSKLHFPKRDKIFLAATIGFTLAFFYFILQILDISPLLARVIQTVSFSSIFVLLCILVSYIFSQNKLAQFYSLGAVSPFVGIMFNTLARNVNAANLVFFGDFLIIFGPAFTESGNILLLPLKRVIGGVSVLVEWMDGTELVKPRTVVNDV